METEHTASRVEMEHAASREGEYTASREETIQASRVEREYTASEVEGACRHALVEGVHRQLDRKYTTSM
jgi:hypothetical protein